MKCERCGSLSVIVKLLYIFRQGDTSEGGTDPPGEQSQAAEPSPQAQVDPPQQVDSSPPVIPESSKEENETEQQDEVKSQLSSSVIIEMPHVQSSLELSTITGTIVGWW